MRPLRRWLRASGHVAGLWALAAAYPVLDTLARAPEFFVAHRADGWDLATLAVLLSWAAPLAFAVAAGAATLLGPAAVNVLTAAAVGLLVAVYGIQVGYRAGVVAWPATIAVAGACALVAAVAWWRSRGVRVVLNVLAAAALAVPVLFLGSRDMRPLLRSAGTEGVVRQPSNLPPVVVLVFDELPLVSLLDASGGIDPVRFPNLAALAADGVWFRNATTVSDYTRWAMPAIAAGRYPEPHTVPASATFPHTLFTALARTHRMEVVEPLTALCPPELCRGADVPRSTRRRRMLEDVGVVARHTLLPPVARAGLPDLAQGWSGFVGDTDPLRAGQREGGKKDHVAIASSFIAGIGDDDEQPTLYFLHTIVSHHPPHLLPSGQRIAGFVEPPGKTAQLTWTPASWPVTLYHQGAILQAELVDTLVGRFRARLEQTGLYDEALVVVTADHGISFVPGASLRFSTDRTAAGVVPVPLIMKLPSTRQVRPRGTIDDGNVETIDILPTLADVLGVPVPGPVDGRSAFAPGPGRPEKRVFHDRARAVKAYAPAELVRLRDREVARKVELFGTARWPLPVPEPAMRALVQQPLRALRIDTAPGAPRVVVDNHEMFEQVDLSASELPVQVRGRVMGAARSGRAPVHVAIALNGVVAAMTRTSADRARWMALVPPEQLRNGFNDLEAFTVDAAQPTTLVSRRTWQEPPDGFDLMSDGAASLGVQHAGFYRREVAGGTPFHWTRGTAEVTVAAGERFARQELDVAVLFTGRAGKRLRVLVNDCEVLSDVLPDGPWSRRVPLGRCVPPGRWATLRLVSDVHRAGQGARPLGIALARLALRTDR